MRRDTEHQRGGHRSCQGNRFYGGFHEHGDALLYWPAKACWLTASPFNLISPACADCRQASFKHVGRVRGAYASWPASPAVADFQSGHGDTAQISYCPTVHQPVQTNNAFTGFSVLFFSGALFLMQPFIPAPASRPAHPEAAQADQPAPEVHTPVFLQGAHGQHPQGLHLFQPQVHPVRIARCGAHRGRGRGVFAGGDRQPSQACREVRQLPRGAALRIPGRQHLGAVRLRPQRGLYPRPPRQRGAVQVSDCPV